MWISAVPRSGFVVAAVKSLTSLAAFESEFPGTGVVEPDAESLAIKGTV
jgi:hypothetical protein